MQINLQPQQTKDSGGGCSISPKTWSLCISDIVYIFTAGIMSVFAYVGGMIFSVAVHMALSSTAYSLTFISSAWAAIRDVANIMFIFILVYLSFIIMFGAETHGTNRMLATVLIMALLINFSFFFTRVVIDAGNILAVQFYNDIPAPSVDTSAQLGNPGATIVQQLGQSPQNTKDLTAAVMDAIQVTNIFNTNAFQQFHNQNGFLTNVIVLSLIWVVLGIIFGILASTFFFAGFKFVYRIIALWFVIIFSPLAFVARGLTNNATARTFYRMWQNMLVQYTLYPAVFLFIFMIDVYFLNQLGGGTGLISGLFKDLNQITNNGTNAISQGGITQFIFTIATIMGEIAFRLGIAIIMLYFGLRIADRLGTEANSAAERVTGWAGRTLGGATYGLVGYGARNTIGAASRKYAPTAQKNASTATGTMSKLWYNSVNTMNKQVAQGSFDPRGNRAGLRQLTLKGSRFDIGKAPNKKDWVKNPSPSLAQTVKRGVGPKFDQKKLDKIDSDIKKQQAGAQQQNQQAQGGNNRQAARPLPFTGARITALAGGAGGARTAGQPGNTQAAQPGATGAPQAPGVSATPAAAPLTGGAVAAVAATGAAGAQSREEVETRAQEASNTYRTLRETRAGIQPTGGASSSGAAPSAPSASIPTNAGSRPSSLSLQQELKTQHTVEGAGAAPAPHYSTNVPDSPFGNPSPLTEVPPEENGQKNVAHLGSAPASQDNLPPNETPPAAPAAARPSSASNESSSSAPNLNAPISDQKIAASGNPLTAEPERLVPTPPQMSPKLEAQAETEQIEGEEEDKTLLASREIPERADRSDIKQENVVRGKEESAWDKAQRQDREEQARMVHNQHLAAIRHLTEKIKENNASPETKDAADKLRNEEQRIIPPTDTHEGGGEIGLDKAA